MKDQEGWVSRSELCDLEIDIVSTSLAEKSFQYYNYFVSVDYMIANPSQQKVYGEYM